MAQANDSSVLFSLKQLMSLEEERLKAEEEQKQRVADELLRGQLEAQRRAREEEETRLRAADEQRRLAEVRAREEAARLDAIRHGEIERARFEAENAARLEALRRQQAHERELAALSVDSGKKRLRLMAVGLGVLLVLGAAGGAFAIHTQAKKAAESELAMRQQLDELQERKNKLEKEREAAGHNAAAIEELNRKLEALAAEKKKIEQSAPNKVPRNPSAPAATVRKKTDKPCIPCRPGDPMCVDCQ